MRWFASLAAVALCAACADPPPKPAELGPPVTTPVRFLLTFDDGPSTWEPYNPTRAILEQLQHNPVQPDIKGIFFVQTRDPRAGGGPAGQVLLHRIHAEGHVLGLHTGTAGGHIRHTRLSDAELAQSLHDGMADIEAITGAAPTLLRPPSWRYDERTVAAYHAAGLHMLLTDINARDGKIYGWNMSLRRRSHFQAGLVRVRQAIAQGRLQPIDGVVPVIITFHDVNTYTAGHMQEYLEILMEKAGVVGLPLARPPFYNEGGEIQRVAEQRAKAGVYAGPP